MFEFLWFDLLYKPLYNLLILFYMASPGPDMGYAVIILTVAIRLLLLPFSIRGARSEHRLNQLEPVFEEIKERYKYNLEKQREATRTVLRENNIGIFSNVMSLLFQVVFILVLYSIFSSGLQLIGRNELYAWMPEPGVINTFFNGTINLIIPDNGISLFAAIVVFLSQALRRVKRRSDANAMDTVMLIALPIGTYIASILLPASKPLFIATSVIFSMILRSITWGVMKMVKDEKTKESLDTLWTS